MLDVESLVLLFQFPLAFVGQMLVGVVFNDFIGFLSCGSFLCISFNKRLSIHKIKVYRHKSYLSSFLTFFLLLLLLYIVHADTYLFLIPKLELYHCTVVPWQLQQ
jgi:hypothetical protein